MTDPQVYVFACNNAVYAARPTLGLHHCQSVQAPVSVDVIN